MVWGGAVPLPSGGEAGAASHAPHGCPVLFLLSAPAPTRLQSHPTGLRKEWHWQGRTAVRALGACSGGCGAAGECGVRVPHLQHTPGRCQSPGKEQDSAAWGHPP